MKRKVVKTLALTMTSAMVLTMTAGCGSSGGSDTKTDSTDTGTEDTADDADTGSTETETGTKATAADIGEPNGGKEVTLWHYFEHEADALNAVVKNTTKSKVISTLYLLLYHVMN